MKKLLLICMMICLVFCLGGCNFPWDKEKTGDKNVRKENITASEVKDSMKGKPADHRRVRRYGAVFCQR